MVIAALTPFMSHELHRLIRQQPQQRHRRMAQAIALPELPDNPRVLAPPRDPLALMRDPDVLQFARSFTVFFVGALIFLG